MSKGPDAYEFDKTDPLQHMRDFFKIMKKMVEDGRGEETAAIMRRQGDDMAAGLVEGLIHKNEDPHMEAMDGVIAASNGGDLDGALAVIDRAQNAGKLTPSQALVLKGMAYERIGDTEMELETVKEREESGDMAYGYKADLLYRLERYDELAKWCDVWEDSYEDRTGLYLSRARLMYRRGDVAGARRHADAITKLEGHTPGTNELVGDILAGTGDLRGAVEWYNKALGIDFSDQNTHAKKAEALMKMGRPDAAALACRRGLDGRPQSKRLRGILAETGH